MRVGCYRAVKQRRRDVIDPNVGCVDATMRAFITQVMVDSGRYPLSRIRLSELVCPLMNRPESFDPLVDEMLPFPHADEASVGEIIGRDLLECAPDVPLHEAARRMSERRVSSILVVEDDAVQGIWTERDALAVDFDDPATFTMAVREAMSARRATRRVTSRSVRMP